MSKFKKLILILSINLLMTSYTLAESKTVLLDLDYILSNTKIGKNIFQELEKNENKKIEELKSQEKNLKNQENKILASKNIISKDELNKKINDFKVKLNEYKKIKNQEIEKLKKKRSEEILKILSLINPVIQKYMQDNSISIILDKKNVFIADKNYDITEKLIELIDKNLINN